MGMKEYNYYAFEYLSEALIKNPRMGEAKTYEEYEIGDTVVIEKEGRGIFLGRVIGKALSKDVEGYNIVQKVDVSAYFDAIEREKKREELMGLMEEKFREIDKLKKYEYYATLDKEFGRLYEEFKNI
jgi:hypothetical protein